MSQQQDISQEFQKRRTTTWRVAKPWALILLLGWLAVFSISIERTDLFLLCFVTIVVTTIRVNFIIMKYYRCPACSKMPIDRSSRGGLMLNPAVCPRCGAVLK